MNLTELQVELRNIEKHLAALHQEIDNMKPKSEEERCADYRAIDKLATKNAIVNKIIEGMPDDNKKILFSGLSYILVSSETDIYARLLYLTRLSLGSGLNWKSEEIYMNGLTIEDVDDIVKGIEAYKRTFLVEAFIISNIKGESDEKSLSIIADIAMVMGCDQEELRVIAQVAKCKLIDNMDKLHELPVPIKNRWMKQFWEYIPYDWIEKNRIECGELCIKKYHKAPGSKMMPTLFGTKLDISGIEKSSSPCTIENRCQAGSIIKAGQTICKYSEEEKTPMKLETFGSNSMLINMSELGGAESKRVEKELKAPCDGIVFFIKEDRIGESKDHHDEYIIVYVVSYFDDYTDFDQWFKNNRKEA